MHGNVFNIRNKLVKVFIMGGNTGFEQGLCIIMLFFIGTDIRKPFPKIRFMDFWNEKRADSLFVPAYVYNAAGQVTDINQHGNENGMGKVVAAGKIEKIIKFFCIKSKFCKPFCKGTVYLIEIFHVKIIRRTDFDKTHSCLLKMWFEIVVKKRNVFVIAGVYKKDDSGHGKRGQIHELNKLFPLIQHFLDLYKTVIGRNCCKNNIFFHNLLRCKIFVAESFFERNKNMVIKNKSDLNQIIFCF